MLQTRIITAALLLFGLLACLFWLPKLAWDVVMLLPLVVGLSEWGSLSGWSMKASWGYSLLGTILTVVLENNGFSVWMYVGSLILWLLIVPMWLAAGWRLTSSWWRVPLGLLVLSPLWAALVELRAHGSWWVLLIMSVVWIADSAAYFTGRWFGRHKLAPAISPGKTWEGVLGAVIAVMVYCGAILAALYSQQVNPQTWVIPIILMAILMLYLGILGDLFESWIKRLATVKDSGVLLPGHGGMLDRIDALTSTLPVAAFILLHSDLLRSIA